MPFLVNGLGTLFGVLVKGSSLSGFEGDLEKLSEDWIPSTLGVFRGGEAEGPVDVLVRRASRALSTEPSLVRSASSSISWDVFSKTDDRSASFSSVDCSSASWLFWALIVALTSCSSDVEILRRLRDTKASIAGLCWWHDTCHAYVKMG